MGPRDSRADRRAAARRCSRLADHASRRCRRRPDRRPGASSRRPGDLRGRHVT